MAAPKKSFKRVQIDKTMATIVLVVSAAAVVSAFSLVSIKALISQHSYQSRVIAQQKVALRVAKADVTAAKDLSTTYSAFNGAPINYIGGSLTGVGPQDGDNSKIILDALPRKYDFPAVITSLEKLAKDRGFKIDSLSGTDDVTLSDSVASATPVSVEMPFQLAVTGSYTSVQDLVGVLDRSIRPISISTLQLSGGESNISIVISAKTYYQPAKTLKIVTKVVK